MKSSDGFCVSSLDEADTVKKYVNKPVLCLQGCYEIEEFRYAYSKNISLVLHNTSQVNLLLKAGVYFDRIWVKYDTGMNRLGFCKSKITEVCSIVAKYCKQIVLMTHLHSASGENINKLKTNTQNIEFLNVSKSLPSNTSLYTSISNSGGVINFPNISSDINRLGISLYGSNFASNFQKLGFKAVSSLESKFIEIKNIRKGEFIGYDHSWQAHENCKVGILPIGYADNFPNLFTKEFKVKIRNKLFPVIGRISMDYIHILLFNDDISIGDKVVLWDKDYNLDQIAKKNDIIPYKIMTSFSSRIKRFY